MRNPIWNQMMAGNLLIAGLVFVLGGEAAAHADRLTVQQRAEQEMNRGKDYTAAWAAASREAARDEAPAYSIAEIARARAAEDALNEGKDYSAAWSATKPTDGSPSPDQIATAARVLDGLLAGKDYVAARDAADRPQPTSVRAVEPAPTNMARGEEASATK